MNTLAKSIKFKPILMTREDGSTYAIDDFSDNLQVLRDVAKMPRQNPISFSDGYRLWSEQFHYILDQQGGRAAGEWINQTGGFPMAVKTLGYHIELSTGDFDLI